MTTLHDLTIAYRKAKVDLYYSTSVSLDAVVKYEKNLKEKLDSLLIRLNGEDESWVSTPEFLGGWTLATKSINAKDLERYRKEHGNGLIFSSPSEEWNHFCTLVGMEGDKYEKPKAEFRLMANCSLDFHVLSVLWIMQVGSLYDACLTDCAFGNRLRRTNRTEQINPFSLGTFKPYLKPFRDWRDNGIKAMKLSLGDNKKVVALTADVSAFYHRLNPDFLQNPDFLEKMEITLNTEQTKINRLFITALKAWAQATPLKGGLPVGLPASAVVANAALAELDRIVERELVPLYYGRYVDDILLVMENGANFRSTEQVWEWIFARSNGLLGWVEPTESEDLTPSKEIEFKPEYLNGSKVRFANSKNKVFLLEGETGKTLVDTIAHQIYERAREWRAMPRLPAQPEQVASALVSATQHDGELADNLRKADVVTMRRAGFALKLRDFEAYERDLRPQDWKKHRHAFLDAFVRHVLVLPHFFELSIYLPRVVRLATACEDFEHLSKIYKALFALYQTLGKQGSVSIKEAVKDSIQDPAILECWKDQVLDEVREAIIAAFPTRLSSIGKRSWKQHLEDAPIKDFWLQVSWPIGLKAFYSLHTELFNHDLAHMPFRFIGLPKELVSRRGIPPKKSIVFLGAVDDLLPEAVVEGLTELGRWMRVGKQLPVGLLFPTRPYTLPELYVMSPNPFARDSQQGMEKVIKALRGFTPKGYMPIATSKRVYKVPDGSFRSKLNVAVSSWKMDEHSWMASMTKTPDTSLKRYFRLNHMMDGVISQPDGARYLILPELAIPAQWFIRVANKLRLRGISLITGVEYLHAGKGVVRHQVWSSLTHDGLGFPSLMIYRQDKQRPALHEERGLQQLANLRLAPKTPWKKPPIIDHGGFRFSILVCSELTDIGYRSSLRGKVDALFVPEWNQDTETFNALVESAALDIHAFIVQCNNRVFGDSRIRAPYKDSWRRDVLRVKGGIHDYCVSGQVEVLALRQFQSSYRSPEVPFKPVPDGFEICGERKVLPVGEKE